MDKCVLPSFPVPTGFLTVYVPSALDLIWWRSTAPLETLGEGIPQELIIVVSLGNTDPRYEKQNEQQHRWLQRLKAPKRLTPWLAACGCHSDKYIYIWSIAPSVLLTYKYDLYRTLNYLSRMSCVSHTLHVVTWLGRKREDMLNYLKQLHNSGRGWVLLLILFKVLSGIETCSLSQVIVTMNSRIFVW